MKQEEGGLGQFSAFEDVNEWARQFAGEEVRILRNASKNIIEEYKYSKESDGLEFVLERLERLVYSGLKEGRMIAGFALEDGILKTHWSERAAKWIYDLANDTEWDVREGAQLALKAAFEAHFDAVFETIQKWTHDPNPNIRRTALMGCRPKPRMPEEQVVRRWALVETLIDDDAEYVKRNMPYVLGFWRTYPEVILPRLLCLAHRSEAVARRNIALSLNGSVADNNPTKTIEILKILASDERRTVRSAVIKALTRLLRKHPVVAKKELCTWLNEDELRTVAEELLMPE